MTTRARSGFAAAVLMLVSGSALAMPPMSLTPSRFEVLRADLRPAQGRLVGLTPDAATLLSEQTQVTVPGYLAVTPVGFWSERREWPGIILGADATSRLPSLELTDGSRIVGRPAPGSDADTLRWDHRALGVVGVKLDRVRRIVLDPLARTAITSDGKSDAVYLSNGDVLSGFFAGLGERDEHGTMTLVCTIETGGQATAIPLARVTRIELSNPVAAPAGARVWLLDGSCFGAEQLALADKRSMLVSVGERTGVRVPLREVRAVVPDASRLTALADLPIVSQEPAPGRYWTPPVSVVRGWEQALGAGEVTLLAPGAASWSLPAGATQVSGWLVLPEPCRARGIAPVSVRVLGASGEIGRLDATLTAQSPVVPLNLALPGTGPVTLQVRLDEGPGGGVQTSVTIRRGVVVSEPKGAGR